MTTPHRLRLRICYYIFCFLGLLILGLLLMRTYTPAWIPSMAFIILTCSSVFGLIILFICLARYILTSTWPLLRILPPLVIAVCATIIVIPDIEKLQDIVNREQQGEQLDALLARISRQDVDAGAAFITGILCHYTEAQANGDGTRAEEQLKQQISEYSRQLKQFPDRKRDDYAAQVLWAIREQATREDSATSAPDALIAFANIVRFAGIMLDKDPIIEIHHHRTLQEVLTIAPKINEPLKKNLAELATNTDSPSAKWLNEKYNEKF